MSILVNGLKVRSYELNSDLEVSFKDLNEKGQHRLFKENKNVFLYDALTSKYKSIQKLPLQFKREYSSETLNSTIMKLLPNVRGKDTDLVLELLNIPGFEVDEELRKKLAHSVYYPFNYWVAESEKTSSEILKDMFLCDVGLFVRNDWANLLDSIISNPNFKFDSDLSTYIKTRYHIRHYNRVVEKIKLINPSALEN